MRKVISLTFILFLMSFFAFTVSAYETDVIKIDIPEIFSVPTENSVDGSDVKQWTDSADGSNVSITVSKNNGFSYADLTDAEKASVHTSFIAQVEKDVIDLLKQHSVEYKITDSISNNVEINGAKGIELIYDSLYTYENGSTLEAKNHVYLFSSENNVVTVAAIINSADKLNLVEELMNSFVFKEEVYVISESDKLFDSYSLVMYVCVGVAVGGAVGLFIAKRKKSNVDTNLPVS